MFSIRPEGERPMSACVEAASTAASSPSIDARAARLAKFERERVIVEYLNRGVSVSEIAAHVGVSEKRMRAIIREILARRIPAPPEEFVAIQVNRLNEALLVAYRAVDRVVRIVRELDRYHGFVAAERRLPDASRLEAPAQNALTFGAALFCRAECNCSPAPSY
jgi:transposase-like protein